MDKVTADNLVLKGSATTILIPVIADELKSSVLKCPMVR